LKNEVAKLSLDTLGYVLFRCEGEEQAQFGTGAYDIPGFGKTVYCGLQGIYPLIKRIQNFHDLGHPLCGNLRAGNWISEYTVNRLRRLPELEKVAQIFDDTLSLLAHLPHFLRPCYFERLFSYLYDAVREVTLQKIFDSTSLPNVDIVRKLCLSSVSFMASINNAKLPKLAPAVAEAHPDPPSLAAGLPHFAEGIWRNWGRDTFIALPGILLLTGRFE
ncbi:CRE-AGL-1 protein, partial [Aphelenchoides avenae]